jgi:hypothetical protein
MSTLQVLTRRELYDLVWSRPMKDLAADFGISDVGPGKICDRYRVPKPGPPAGDVHAAIKRTAQALRKAKPDANGAVQAIGDGLCGVDVAATNVERVIALLEALAGKLEAKSLPLKPTGQAMSVTVGLDSATFTITERTRREKHIPTPEDLAAEERRRKKLRRHWHSSAPWNDAYVSLVGRAYPEFDVVYTGALAFQIEGYSEGVRRRWADGKTQTVEALLDDITVGLEAVLAVRKSRREEQEERERRWQERARRRELARKRAEREEERANYLNSIINAHNKIGRLHQWLADAEAVSKSSAPSALTQLINWARQRLAKLETMVDPVHIDHDLKEKGLFPEIDKLHDPEGDPPDEPYFW